jgi:hypothetical protein
MSIQMQLGDYVSVRTGNRRSLYFYTGVVQEIFKSKVRVKCEITFAEHTRYETYIFPKEKIVRVGKTRDEVKIF